MSSIESNIEYDLSTDDSEDDALNLPGLAANGVPGLIVSVEFDDSITAPLIEDGKVRMPRSGGSAGLVQFGGDLPTAVGMLAGMEFATGIGEIMAKGGVVQFPLAEYEGYFGTNVAGAVAGAQYATGISSPRINNGMIEIPEGGGEIQPASFEGNITTSVEPGGLKGAEFNSNVSQIEAKNGLFCFPLAATVDLSYTPMSTAVAGAIAGIRYAPGVNDPESGGTSITQPRILPGGLIEMPPPGTGSDDIKGVVNVNGSSVAWADFDQNLGNREMVAVYQYPTVFGDIAMSLYVGMQNGFLTFSLTDYTP